MLAADKWSGLLALLLAWHEEQLQDGVAVRLRHWLNSFNRRQIPPTPEQLRQCREAFTRTLPLAEEIASVLGLAI